MRLADDSSPEHLSEILQSPGTGGFSREALDQSLTIRGLMGFVGSRLKGCGADVLNFLGALSLIGTIKHEVNIAVRFTSPRGAERRGT